MFLLRDEGYIVPEIRSIANHHDNNIRKWIHRLDEKDIDNMISRKHIRNAHKITEDMHLMAEESITKFSTWSLRVLAGYIIEEKKIIDKTLVILR